MVTRALNPTQTAYRGTSPSSTTNTAPGFLQQDYSCLLLALILSRKSKHHNPTPIPVTDRRGIINDIINNFDALKTAGVDSKDGVFGMEDVDAITHNPSMYSASLVSIANKVQNNSDLVDLADWVSNSSGPFTHDRTNGLRQYQDTLDVLWDAPKIKDVINHLRRDFSRISGLGSGGNSTALERSDLQAEATRLMASSVASDQAMGRTLTKIYYSDNTGPVPSDLITILANASGSNSPTSQTVTLNGLNQLQNVLSR